MHFNDFASQYPRWTWRGSCGTRRIPLFRRWRTAKVFEKLDRANGLHFYEWRRATWQFCVWAALHRKKLSKDGRERSRYWLNNAFVLRFFQTRDFLKSCVQRKFLLLICESADRNSGSLCDFPTISMFDNSMVEVEQVIDILSVTCWHQDFPSVPALCLIQDLIVQCDKKTSDTIILPVFMTFDTCNKNQSF